MKNVLRGAAKLGEDWMSVILGLLVVAVVMACGLARVPWPLFGWLR